MQRPHCHHIKNERQSTYVSWGQRGCRGGGGPPGRGGAGVEDGAVGLVVDQVGHVPTTLLVPCQGGRAGLEVGVGARGVAADWAFLSPVGAGLREDRGQKVIERSSGCVCVMHACVYVEFMVCVW